MYSQEDAETIEQIRINIITINHTSMASANNTKQTDSLLEYVSIEESLVEDMRDSIKLRYKTCINIKYYAFIKEPRPQSYLGIFINLINKLLTQT